MPMVTPATVAMTVVITPTNREIRAPYRMRTNRARPVPSVPGEGGERRGRDGQGHHDHDDDQGRDRHLVVAEPAPGQLPLAAALDGLLGRAFSGRRLEFEIGDAHADSPLPAALAAALHKDTSFSPS